MRKIYLDGSLWVEFEELEKMLRHDLDDQQKQYAEAVRAIELKLEAMEEENRALKLKLQDIEDQPYAVYYGYT
ncbi:MAG: hypothetical protein MN733_17800 [Nitrososphaera sp.]|nr:hypothetical protein [Nitrososphaera sp.]